MLHKSMLLTLLSILFLMPWNASRAQEHTKAFKGDLLTNHRRPQSDLKASFTEAKTNDFEETSNAARRYRAPFRSINGTGNNLSSPDRKNWGAADIPYFRELPADYGPGDPLNEISGKDRPSPREISNISIVEPVTQFTTRNLNSLLYQWGQFIDHDFGLTPTGNTEFEAIPLPTGDTIFTEDIPFFRSEFVDGKEAARDQINLNTSFIDGSMVYGSDTNRAKWLRTFKNGKMKTSEGNLLPYNTIDGEFSSEIDPNAPVMDDSGDGTLKVFIAGDVRASENPVLTSLQTLFVREHNRICDQLVRYRITNDELIYQIARKQVGALIQAITYREFLPSLGIKLKRYRGYNPNIRPDLTNSFAAAAYRIGHTMVSDDVVVVDNDCEELGPGEFDLVETFFNPQLIRDFGIDAFLKGATTHDLYQTDTKINDVLRNFLFGGDASSPVRFGIDLGSINIQRGRDHGLPDYNTARKFYAGKGISEFSEISSNDTIVDNLKGLYKDVNNIDLWIGLLSEDLLPNKSVGNTMNIMLSSQFENLRDGDFYYYLNDPYLSYWSKRRISRTRMSDIIKRNTDITNLFADAFQSDKCVEEEEEEEGAKLVDEANTEKVYPNPFSQILNVDLSSSSEPGLVELYAINGSLVKSVAMDGTKRKIQINTSNFEVGVYIVKIIKGTDTKSLKFVKM